MKQKLEDKKKALQGLLQQKAQQFQNADNVRNQLLNEITGLQANIKLLEEIIQEKESKEVIKEETPKEITSEK